MQFVKSTLLCLVAVGSQPLLYLGLPYWLSGGHLSLPTLVTFANLAIFVVPLCIYFSYWRYDQLINRIPLVAKNQSKLDRGFSFAAQILIFGGYLYAASRVGVEYSLLLIYLGAALSVLGFIVVIWVMLANPYSSAVVAKYENHYVVSTGPYAVVRHPMYLGAAIALPGWVLMFQDPLFGLCIAVAIFLLVIRVPYEEKFLDENLDGYLAYKQRVRYRVFPFVW